MIRPTDSIGGESPSRFPLGQVFATGPILNSLSQAEIFAALRRHSLCDWGEVSAEDWKANDRALVEGTRLLSAYLSASGLKFWVITDADRAITTILLPEEY